MLQHEEHDMYATCGKRICTISIQLHGFQALYFNLGSYDDKKSVEYQYLKI